MGPAELGQALAGLPLAQRAELLVGIEHADDAGVYRLSDSMALVQTVDFFTPIVDDPYTFGAIAAANALSDVYAMGGKPLTAMNIVCFPAKSMDLAILRSILEGGLSKIHEAGAVLAGGHSVQDAELKYGLSVTGLVHPDQVWKNTGARPGDALVITKPLGTGIVATAIKAGVAGAEAEAQISASMASLNASAARIAQEFEIHAATDVTGFGLAGHVAEMLGQAALALEVDAGALPRFSSVEAYCNQGLLPGGLHANRRHLQDLVAFTPGLDACHQDLLFDPQTSGGLLLALDPDAALDLVARLQAGGLPAAAVIGRFVAAPGPAIRVL